MSNWDKYIAELREFDWSGLGSGFRVNGCERVVDPGLFVSSHLATVERYKGTKIGKVYFRRLWKVYKRLNSEK